jgi:hypothetical protein
MYTSVARCRASLWDVEVAMRLRMSKRNKGHGIKHRPVVLALLFRKLVRRGLDLGIEQFPRR